IVSNASEDFPEPLTPLTTVMALCGISTETFFRLWTRAPRTHSVSWFSWPGAASEKVSCFAKRKPRQCVQQALSKPQIILRHETLGKSRFCQSPGGFGETSLVSTAPESVRFLQCHLERPA